MKVRKPRKTAAEQEKADNAITLIQAEAHAQAVREATGAGEAALYGKGFVNAPGKPVLRDKTDEYDFREPVRRLVNDSGVPGALMHPAYDMDAAARVAYESFVRGLGLKIGEKVSDASGVHRIPAWGDHKTFVKNRWRAVAQAVIDAATGVERKVGLTSAPDVQGSTLDVAGYLHNRRQESGRSNEQDLQIRGRQLPKRRATRRARKRPSRRLDSKRS